MAPAPLTFVGGSLLYPPSIIWSIPFLPNLLYYGGYSTQFDNWLTTLPSLPGQPQQPYAAAVLESARLEALANASIANATHASDASNATTLLASPFFLRTVTPLAAAAAPIALASAPAATPAPQIPRTGLRPAAPIAPSRPDQFDSKNKLDHFENIGALNRMALNVLFGPSPTGRSRGYVHVVYGYMPFGDGYGAAQTGMPPGPPWWWDWQQRNAYLSNDAFSGEGTWRPERPTPTCPPDCAPAPASSVRDQPP